MRKVTDTSSTANDEPVFLQQFLNSRKKVKTKPGSSMVLDKAYGDSRSIDSKFGNSCCIRSLIYALR